MPQANEAPCAQNEPMTSATRREGARAGTLVAAVWLIGVGVVLLVRQLLDLPWTTAWPLWVILVGVGSVVGFIMGPRRSLAQLGWPIALTLIGVAFLLSTTGAMGIGPGELAAKGWPLAAIGLGTWFLVAAVWPWSSTAPEQLSLPLESASSASVTLKFGGGELAVDHGPAGLLLAGEFRGGVVVRRRGPGSVELEPASAAGWLWGRDWPSWHVGLTGEVQIDLQLESGANRARLDLGALQLRSLKLQTGASETRVMLPRAAGTTRVRAESGAASLIFEVPPGVAASIRSRMSLGSTNVDTGRFPKVGDRYESTDYATATNRIEIDIQGGVGSLRVTSGRD
jgi:hypothetical protein